LKDCLAASEQLANVRAALEWAFSAEGDTEIGIAIAAAAAPVFLGQSMLSECNAWSERAIAALDERSIGTRLEMDLRTSVGLSLMYVRGNGGEVRRAFSRALELAEALELSEEYLRLLIVVHRFEIRAGNFRTSLELAQKTEKVASALRDPAGIAMANFMLGGTYQYLGEHEKSRPHFETSLARPPSPPGRDAGHFGFAQRNGALACYARLLWLFGYADQARFVTTAVVEEAKKLGHPVTLCIALVHLVPLTFLLQDMDLAAEMIDAVNAHADKHELEPFKWIGLSLKGALLARTGNTADGIPLIEEGLGWLEADGYEIHNTFLRAELAEALSCSGRHFEARRQIDQAIAIAEPRGELFTVPELLRLKGQILERSRPAAIAEIEKSYVAAMEMARSHRALAWELRAAISLARLHQVQKRAWEAKEQLTSIYDCFSEGFGSADLVTARRLLDLPD
jgi:predicted ATPase